MARKWDLYSFYFCFDVNRQHLDFRCDSCCVSYFSFDGKFFLFMYFFRYPWISNHKHVLFFPIINTKTQSLLQDFFLQSFFHSFLTVQNREVVLSFKSQCNEHKGCFICKILDWCDISMIYYQTNPDWAVSISEGTGWKVDNRQHQSMTLEDGQLLSSPPKTPFLKEYQEYILRLKSQSVIKATFW